MRLKKFIGINFAGILLLSATTFLFTSCGEKKEEPKTELNKRSEVVTMDLQESMTPQQMIDTLKKGNDKFVKGDITFNDYPSQIMKSAKDQYPGAVVLSCLDSRVPVEKIFDLTIGDIFVARVAGNIVNPDILGSMEYGCKVAGAKLIVVLGHTECGAVKSAVDDVKLGNITELLEKIRPAVDSVSEYQGDKTSKNKEFVQKVCDENVILAISNIRKNSPILKEMEETGKIKIIGGVYDLSNGKVTFFN